MGRTAKDDDLDAVTIFPDIIVHKRGTNDQNLLVVEVKKASSAISSKYDFEKLRAFKAELRYAFAAHVTIGYTRDGKFTRKVAWEGGETG